MVKLAKEDPNVIFIHWFPETLRMSESYFGGGEVPALWMTRDAQHTPFGERRLIFAEHYPLQEKEKQLFEKLRLEKAEVWSSLDEPIFQKFGGARIAEMMRRMGMSEDEVIDHPLVTKSIRNAQQKIGKKISFEQTASSQEDWFKKNHPAGG